MTEEEFDAWRGSPATEAVFRYMKDYAAAARLEWAFAEGWSEEVRVRVEACEDLANLDFASIETFYEGLGDRIGAVRAMQAAMRHWEREETDDENDSPA